MRILVTNDDGVHSPGIAALARAAARFGDIRIVAPNVEQSSMGHAITANRPLSYHRARLPGGLEAFQVNGTPADCVALGVRPALRREGRPRHRSDGPPALLVHRRAAGSARGGHGPLGRRARVHLIDAAAAGPGG